MASWVKTLNRASFDQWHATIVRRFTTRLPSHGFDCADDRAHPQSVGELVNSQGIVLLDIEDTWTGQFPVTSFVLTALRRKRAEIGVEALNSNERVLLTACEFWIASKRGTLLRCFGDHPTPLLREAMLAFSRLHAIRVVSALRIMHESLQHSRSLDSITHAVRRLSQQLAQSDDDVEGLISEFADTLLGE